MGLTDDFNSDENRTGLPVVYMSVGVVAFILMILCVVLVLNRKESYSEEARQAALQKQQEAALAEQAAEETDLEIGQSTLTSDQLDFWDMYKDDTSSLQDTKTLSENNYEAKSNLVFHLNEGDILLFDEEVGYQVPRVPMTTLQDALTDIEAIQSFDKEV